MKSSMPSAKLVVKVGREEAHTILNIPPSIVKDRVRCLILAKVLFEAAQKVEAIHELHGFVTAADIGGGFPPRRDHGTEPTEQ